MGNKQSRNHRKYNVNNANSNNNNHNHNDHNDHSKQNDHEQPKLVVPVTQSIPEPEKPIMSKTAFVPKWIQEDLFVDVLKENVEDFEKIVKFEAYPALSAGENYATQMLRVAIQVELLDKSVKEITFMLKVAHDSEQMLEMLKTWDFFTIENLVYSEALPALERLYKEKGLDICFGPKGYQIKNSPTTYWVLLEDLRPKGFRNASRREGLNMEHCKLALKKLAQFHAGSAAYIRNVKPFNKTLMDGLGDPNSPEAKAIFGAMMMSFKTSFLQSMHLYKDIEVYEEQVRQRLDGLVDDFLLSMQVNRNDFCVLCHGDFWSNNILFKYSEDDSLEEAYLVDYQATKIGYPSQDLLYFILSSSQLELKTSQFDYMIRYYHDQLVQHLKMLDYPLAIPTLRELQLEVIQRGYFAFVTVVMTLPVVLLDPNENANIENFMSVTDDALEFKNLSYTNPRYIKHLNEVLPFLHNRGLLEPYSAPSLEAAPLSQTAPEPVPDGIKEAPITEDSKEATPVIPEWLTKECFIDILRSKYPNFKDIRDFRVKSGSSAGENYAASLLCINIESELEDGALVNDSFMLKVRLESEQADAMMSLFDVFAREIQMYTKVLPVFEEMYKNEGHQVTFAPKSYQITPDPGCKYVLLENLKPKGFKNQDRLVGLDMNHTKAVLSKLAQFHAVSVAYNHLKGQFDSLFTKGMFNEEARAFMEAMGEKFFSTFLDIVQNYENSDEYLHKIIPFQKAFFDQMLELNQVNPDEFNVMNHGDCWINNVMFQHHDNGSISNTYFIDFQMSKYGSPAQDLYYFLLSSPEFDIKMEHFDYCIKYYHDHLVESLKILNFPGKIPTLRELHLDLIRKHGWGFSVITGVLAAVLLPPTKDASMDNWLGEDEVGMALKKQMYDNPAFRKHANSLLKWLNHRGYLECGLEFEEKNKPKSLIPEWVNEENFREILMDKVENFSKITGFKAEPGTKTGDNYASLILRVTVDFELKDGSTKCLSFMVKALPVSAMTDEMVSAWNFFPKEITMYQTYIPAFEKIFRDVGQDVQFAPKYYQIKTKTDPDNVILEDLRQSGFKNGDRCVGLDEEHTKCVLKKLSQFHAASARYFELNGPYPEALHVGIFKEDQIPVFKQMIGNSDPAFMECAKTYKGSESYIHKMEGFRIKSIDMSVELSKIDPNEFNVLNHGDSWLNNIMFQHDENGKIKETLYVDYQVCKYGSPAQDLYYFLFSSTHVDIKAAKFEEFIEFYHENLLRNLNLLKYEGPIPSLEKFHETLKKYKIFGSMGLVGVGAVALLEPTEKATMENFCATDEEAMSFHKLLFGGKNFRTHADVLFQWFNDRGFFDI